MTLDIYYEKNSRLPQVLNFFVSIIVKAIYSKLQETLKTDDGNIKAKLKITLHPTGQRAETLFIYLHLEFFWVYYHKHTM